MSTEKYFSEIIKDLQKSFYDERGRGARYRTTLVGVDYFKEKYGSDLKGNDWTDAVEKVADALKKESIIDKAEFDGKGNVLNVEFYNCIHQDVENSLAKYDIEPFSCPCANLVMHYVDSFTGSNSELVSIDVKDDKCVIVLGIVGSTLEEI